MESAIAIGISLSDFWEMTPHELSIAIQSINKSKERDFKENMFLAYMNAYLQRVERMPPLKKFIGDNDKKPRQKNMTDQHMFAQVRALNAQLGGKEVRVKKQESSEYAALFFV